MRKYSNDLLETKRDSHYTVWSDLPFYSDFKMLKLITIIKHCCIVLTVLEIV